MLFLKKGRPFLYTIKKFFEKNALFDIIQKGAQLVWQAQYIYNYILYYNSYRAKKKPFVSKVKIKK